jgi:T5SS/PEP-CTERM-associated repeat protein
MKRSLLIPLIWAISVIWICLPSAVQAAITPAGDVSPWIPPYWDTSTTGYVGNTFGGTLTVNGGSTLYSSSAYLGYNSGVFGRVTISGSGSDWVNSSDLYVGYFGNGSLNVLNGGAVDNNGLVYLGYNSGSSGTATVDGSGSILINRNPLCVGLSGNGLLNISNGGTVDGDGGVIGSNSGSSDTVTVDGPSSKWNPGITRILISMSASTATGRLTSPTVAP